jgi:hypothetical protein
MRAGHRPDDAGVGEFSAVENEEQIDAPVRQDPAKMIDVDGARPETFHEAGEVVRRGDFLVNGIHQCGFEMAGLVARVIGRPIPFAL